MKRISELDAVTSAANSDELVINSGTQTKKIALQNLLKSVQTQINTLSSRINSITQLPASGTAEQQAITDVQSRTSSLESTVSTLSSTANALSNSLDNLTEIVDGLAESVVDEYEVKAYEVGDYVMYNGKLYKCAVAIANGETWTESHWTRWQIYDDLAGLKDSLTQTATTLTTLDNSFATLQNNVQNMSSDLYGVVDEVETARTDAHGSSQLTLDERIRSDIAELGTLKVDGGYVDEEGYLVLTSGGEPVGDRLGPFIGGGGGGGGGSVNNAKLTVTNTSGWLYRSISTGSELVATFEWSSIEDEVPTGDGTIRVTVNNVLRLSRNIQQGNISVDFGALCSTGNNIIRVNIADTYGNSRTINFTVNCVELVLKSGFDTSAPFSGRIEFPFIANGNATKVVHFILDGTEIGTMNAPSGTGRQLTYLIPAQSHGSHSLRVYFMSDINGESTKSNELYYEIACLESGNYSPIITTSFNQASVGQYSTVIIPYKVYDPSEYEAAVSIYEGETLLSSLTVNRSEQNLSYRAATAGETTIRFVSGSTIKEVTFTVTASEIQPEAETNALALHLTSYGRSNNEANPLTWTYRSGANTISANFTGFNLKNDGWQQDADGITVLRLADDARVTIPYQIFSSEFATSGKTIEIEFATREVVDYSATIVSCFSDDIGLKITPQSVMFKGAQTQIDTLYKDNEHIRLSIVVEKQTDYRLILIYINGIMSRAIQYASGERFKQTSPVGISIGSSNSGIDIYNIRVYDNNLGRKQILNNWVADTQIGTLMIDRYSRNDVYDGDEITVNSIPSDLPYFILNAEELPQYKGDKKTISGQYYDPLQENKCFFFEGCQINVQGTSSAPYYRKNYDMQFKSGFEMGRDQLNTTHADTYGIKTNSIPFNRFVIKADVASSESTNNTGLTMFYNDTCPYKTPEMLEDSRVRWGIEGVPIVVFWHDTLNDKMEFLGKYNFNLPKRAPQPYGYPEEGTMESWEWQRNNSANVKFQDDDFTTQAWSETDQKYYPVWQDDFEARFPEDTWDDIAKLKEMISWVKSTWRDQATNATLPASATFRLNTTATIDPYPNDNSYTVVDEKDGSGLNTGYKLITFTKDTEAYRLSKFRAEFPDYFEVDSAIFYYLYTELLLMIDSRAKNMFIGFNGSPISIPGRAMDRLATLQPYDMDTAIGTNNSGVLMFGYSLEDTMTVSSVISGGDTAQGSEANVFNAQDSVLFMNLRDAYRAEITTMYRNLRAANGSSGAAWSYRAIEDMYEKHQSKWPEAIFNEDAYEKYIVPLVEPVTVDEDTGQLIRTDRYLTMLQGSKTEQRKWWLSNRFRYMDSKFVTGDATSKLISMRVFTSGNATLTLTPAIDLYVGVSWGGGTTVALQRTEANVPASFTYTESAQEMETWIYSGDLLRDVGDLSVFYPNEIQFANATRLTNLKIGSGESGYSNANLRALDVHNSTLLRTIDVRNCPNLAINVNLEGSPRLREAYFDGTSITGVSLPDGCAIETLHLPGTITTLILQNLDKLTTLVCPSFANVSTLMLSNMNTNVVDPVTILESVKPGSYVNIQGLSLEMANTDEVDDFLSILDTMDGVTRERVVNDAGEYYWSYQYPETAQVVGSIHIPSMTGAQGADYAERYPYIKINADHTTSYLRYYTYDGSQLLYTETIQDGADGGTYTGRPTRAATIANTYEFIGWSKSKNATVVDADALKAVKYDRNVYAAYHIEGQVYTVTFKNSDGTVLQTVTNVPYGTDATYTGETPLSPEGTTEEFRFNGWSPAPTNIQGNTICVAQYQDLRSPVITYLLGTIDHVETGVSSVAEYGLGYQINLEVVDLTSTSPVTINANAFYGDTKLTHLIIRSTTMSTLSNANAFTNTNINTGNGAIYVPSNLVATYKADSKWGNYVIFPISKYPATSFDTIEDSWTDIITNIGNGSYTTKYTVGDTKSIDFGTLGVHKMQIVAMGEDVLSDGSGNTAPITWVMKDILTAHRMNDSTTGITGGWESSDIRTYLKEIVKPLIPEEIRNHIVTVNKISCTYENGAKVKDGQTTQDDVWIPGNREVFNVTDYETTGAVYNDIFKDSSSRIKLYNSSTINWWLRSAYANNYACYVGANGNYGGVSVGNYFGVVLGFCLG